MKEHTSAASYEDMLQLPHPSSEKHPRMPSMARAAQFAPFAALSGHNTALYETERQTMEKPSLSEDRLQELDQRLQLLQQRLSEHPNIRITYFVPDRTKYGGSYQNKTGSLRLIDHDHKKLIFSDGCKIELEHIVQLEPDP